MGKIAREGIEFIPMAVLKSWEGISSYRGVIIIWDEDFDSRVLSFVDSVDSTTRRGLLSVLEHEGAIKLVWRDGIVPPPKYRNGSSVEVYVNGEWNDSWVVVES